MRVSRVPRAAKLVICKAVQVAHHFIISPTTQIVYLVRRIVIYVHLPPIALRVYIFITYLRIRPNVYPAAKTV